MNSAGTIHRRSFWSNHPCILSIKLQLVCPYSVLHWRQALAQDLHWLPRIWWTRRRGKLGVISVLIAMDFRSLESAFQLFHMDVKFHFVECHTPRIMVAVGSAHSENHSKTVFLSLGLLLDCSSPPIELGSKRTNRGEFLGLTSWLRSNNKRD